MPDTQRTADASADLNDLRMSEAARPLYDHVKKFIAEEIDPKTEEYFRLGENRAENWGYGEGQLELLQSIKDKAKEQGLWNFFLPNAETGEMEWHAADGSVISEADWQAQSAAAPDAAATDVAAVPDVAADASGDAVDGEQNASVDEGADSEPTIEQGGDD